uniref:Laminin G domain-containing protein n=1 Tax=Periophthalmus magnuspinnatus TaxID=409849 RepID=A0A3B4AUL2_9GOBI
MTSQGGSVLSLSMEDLRALPGNTNADSVVQYKLEQPVIARFLRLIPLDWNPTGRIGLRLEVYGCPYTSDVARFDGGSALVYKLAARPSSADTESVAFKFKSLQNSGTLLHAEGRGEHGLTLVLEKGRLLSLSAGQLLASGGSLLDDEHWHYVRLERVKNRLNVTVDSSTQTVHLPLSVGSAQTPGLQRPVLSNRNLSGCLENLIYNNLNLIELAKKNNQQVHMLVSAPLQFSNVKLSDVFLLLSRFR